MIKLYLKKGWDFVSFTTNDLNTITSNENIIEIKSLESSWNKNVPTFFNTLTSFQYEKGYIVNCNNANPEKYKINNTQPKDDKIVPDKLMISQEMFVRQLNMLKRSGKFILDNAKPKVIAEDKDESVNFLVHLNNMQLTFDNLLTNQSKYTLTDETKKCISEAESLKKQLDELANNWDIDSLFVNIAVHLSGY